MHRELSGKQLRYLRGIGHHLKPLVILGKDGITEGVIKTVEAVLAAHELIKIKVGSGCPLKRREAADTIALKTGAETVQILGKILLVYRENPERSVEHKVQLPE